VLVTDDVIGLLSAQYIELLASFPHLIPEAREILEYLKPNYRLHIITNGFHEVQTKKLVNSNIHEFFELVINSEMAGVKKPNPHIFKLALQKAGVMPQKALMIGDNVEADILGARAVGFHTLHYNAHGDADNTCGLMVGSLGEIKSLL
jgi:putative hydrolase of the HAD superfamily